jgi:hypothetical protein
MFVDVELPITVPPAVAVPGDAVIDSGLTKVVYVDTGGGMFAPRRVETGRQLGDHVEILRGISPGERIVVSGTFLLDAESRMRLAAATSGGPAGRPEAALHSHAGLAHAGHGHGSAHTADASDAQREGGLEDQPPHSHHAVHP